MPQATASTPTPTAPNPTIAPTIECVVETGQPREDAINSQVAAAKSEASIPYTSNSGLDTNDPESRMPFRTVAVTSPPARTAPANSNIIAITTACLNVIAPEPTDVPIAFATSLAPIPQAINKPNPIPSMIRISLFCTIISMKSSGYFVSITSKRDPTFWAASAVSPSHSIAR